jgi:hypothetical protein
MSRTVLALAMMAGTAVASTAAFAQARWSRRRDRHGKPSRFHNLGALRASARESEGQVIRGIAYPL